MVLKNATLSAHAEAGNFPCVAVSHFSVRKRLWTIWRTKCKTGIKCTPQMRQEKLGEMFRDQPPNKETAKLLFWMFFFGFNSYPSDGFGGFLLRLFKKYVVFVWVIFGRQFFCTKPPALDVRDVMCPWIIFLLENVYIYINKSIAIYICVCVCAC